MTDLGRSAPPSAWRGRGAGPPPLEIHVTSSGSGHARLAASGELLAVQKKWHMRPLKRRFVLTDRSPNISACSTRTQSMASATWVGHMDRPANASSIAVVCSFVQL
ncbi:protein of unknown function [Burkholderia multivorans]